MSKIRQHLALYLFPIVVFGYAVYSNGLMLLSDGQAFRPSQASPISVSGFLDGAITREIDSVYKKEVPHRDLAVGLGGNLRYSVFGTGRKGVVVGNGGWLYTNEEFTQISRTDIDDAVQNIAAIKVKLAEKGTTLVVLPLPAKSDVYSEYVPDRVKTDDMALAYAGFIAAMQKASIDVVDTKSALLVGKANAEVFLRSDTHWSPTGAKLTAAAAAKALSKTGVRLEASQIVYAQTPAVSIWGDLTKYITLPDYAPEIGLEPENLELFRSQAQSDGGALDLFGNDATVPVVLVGTSYSANENWSFTDYLRQSLKSDVVNVAKEGVGPGIPMMEFLTSETLATAKPKVVFWEFPVRYIGTPNLWTRATTVINGHGQTTAGGGNV